MVDGSALDWLQLLGLAALVGAGGQGIRVIVGVKKLNDAAPADTGLAGLIVPSKLVISLFIGAIAGTLAALASIAPGARLTGQELAGLAAAGYAGADFIEGFMSRAVPAVAAPAGKQAVGVAPPLPAPPKPPEGQNALPPEPKA